MASQEVERFAYAAHLKQECSFDCAFCAAHAVRIDWDAIDLLCPDARWSPGSKHPPKARSGNGPGRPHIAEPRRNRLAVLLTDAERAAVDAYAASVGLSAGTAARAALLQAVNGGASRVADTASEGGSYTIPWERRCKCGPTLQAIGQHVDGCPAR